MTSISRPPVLPSSRRNRGIALLAVLWVLAAAGTAVALGLGAMRDAIATSRYRTEFTRARWAAEGCLAEFRAGLERTIAGSSLTPGADPWIAPRHEVPPGCVIGLEPPPEGPVDVNLAPESVLVVLPGFDREVVDLLLRARAGRRRLSSLDQLLGELPDDLRDRVAAHYAELVGQVVFRPAAWVVTARGEVAGRSIAIATERWVLAGERVAVVRREIR